MKRKNGNGLPKPSGTTCAAYTRQSVEETTTPALVRSMPNASRASPTSPPNQRHWTLKCSGCGEWTALDKVFPQKLGQEVTILIPREDGSVYRACPKCAHELDTEQGEWVADFPSRSIRGYLISQLFSSTVDPKEILEEYRTTHYPDRFYNLKIGIPWADISRRLDASFVLSFCTDEPMAEEREANQYLTMGVDTGKQLHCVILKEGTYPNHKTWKLVHLAVCSTFEEVDELSTRFKIGQCVIDGLPETHATRSFVNQRWRRYMAFFNEHQRGEPKWDDDAKSVVVNRTEALDASRALVRDGKLLLPRRCPIVEEFATHMAADAKVLDEDEETGVKKYRYIRTGPDHFSLAFTYALLAGTGRDGMIRDVSQIPLVPDPYAHWEELLDGRRAPRWEDLR